MIVIARCIDPPDFAIVEHRALLSSDLNTNALFHQTTERGPTRNGIVFDDA